MSGMQDNIAFIRKRMRHDAVPSPNWLRSDELPEIADLIRKIDRALIARRAV